MLCKAKPVKLFLGQGGPNYEYYLGKKIEIEIVYNGVTKPLQVQPEEQITALLQNAIAVFAITQQPHLLSLFRQDGSVVPEGESIEKAGIKPGEILLLRPNAVKGGALLRVGLDIVSNTFRMLRECGRRECECVVYWTGPATEDLVDAIEHPTHTRSAFGYEVDDNWLTQLWKRLAVSKRSIKAQLHTHPRRAFHSETDDEWPIISQVGFLSIVIPNFATGRPSLEAAWVGYLQQDGKWRHLSSAADAVVTA